MGDDHRITPHDAAELAACFRAHASRLFGHACVLARGDRALADDLVQATFEAAARVWQTLRGLAEEQLRGWLRSTLANIAASGFRREAAFRDRLPQIEERYRDTQALGTPFRNRPLRNRHCPRSRWNAAGGSSGRCRRASTWWPYSAGNWA